MNNEIIPGNSDSIVMVGSLKGKLRRTMLMKQFRGSRGRIYFDGLGLDNIMGEFSFSTQEDIDRLVDFLKISKHCLPSKIDLKSRTA